MILIALVTFGNKFYAQKDTLHIYYSGMQTNVSDSSEAKIGKWMKSLNGRHVDVEICAYYDNSDFKKYMVERAENLHLIVNRKARDLITVKFIGPVKGKKWQRYMADVVYTSSNVATPAPPVNVAEKKEAPIAVETENVTPTEKKTKAAKPAEKKEETKVMEQKEKPAKPPKEEKPAKAPKEEKVAKAPKEKKEETKTEETANKKYDIVMDSTYVNGVLKVTKRKVKKQ